VYHSPQEEYQPTAVITCHSYFRLMIAYADFDKVDIRVGRVITAEDFPDARKPAYKLSIDFGPEIGIKRSSAQIVKHYNKEDLLGSLVLAVVNFPPKQIGPFMSEVLTLGVPDEAGDIVLIRPSSEVPPGSRMF
jgi:tRNA-binding protein